MKTLDKRASEILRALLALQTSKIDNTDEAYMPVYIEINDSSETGNRISLAQDVAQSGNITGSITGIGCATPIFSLPSIKKHGNSFRTTTVTIIWEWNSTA